MTISTKIHYIRKSKPDFHLCNILEPEILSSLVHKIGHEIGNPLTSIISMASLIEYFSNPKLKTSENKSQQYALSITKEAWKIAGISQKLVLLLSNKQGSPSLCSLMAAFSHSIEKLKSRNSTGAILVDIDMSKIEKNSKVFCDQDQLLALISELIENAQKAVSKFPVEEPQCPLISISSESNLRHTSFSISSITSTACPLELNEIFKPLVTSYPNDRHIGIGLTMAYAIIKRAGGDLEAKEETVDNEKNFCFSIKATFPSCSLEAERC